MDILPIQATSVPCERVFSSAKETTTPRRNRITPSMMGSLQLLKFSYKKRRDPEMAHCGGMYFTQALDSKHELSELEELQDGPDDLAGYRSRLNPSVATM